MCDINECVRPRGDNMVALPVLLDPELKCHLAKLLRNENLWLN